MRDEIISRPPSAGPDLDLENSSEKGNMIRTNDDRVDGVATMGGRTPVPVTVTSAASAAGYKRAIVKLQPVRRLFL